MIPFEDMKYHSTTEQLTNILQDITQRDDTLFFRLMVSYYFCMAAAQMRCSIDTPDRGVVPVNMYLLNLAPSGYGKTMATNFIEENVLQLFRHRFLQETFPILANENLPKLATKRAARKGTDPEEELVKVEKEFNGMGALLFSFDSGTSPAVKQMRHKLLMANAGSMNLIMDEVGANLSANKEVFDTFIELYDKGLVKQKLIKNTSDNTRSEEIIGKTPANLLMFGVPSRLLDGAKTEEDLMEMLSMGYARRCFFGYVRNSNRKRNKTAEQMFDDRISTNNHAFTEKLSDRLENLADLINANKKLSISKTVCIELNEYQLHCEARADKLPDHKEIQKRELTERNFKVLKLAGAYAFIDNSPEVTLDHVHQAIKLAEDSGEAFSMLLARDKPWVKLAKYIAAVGTDITQADLAEDLPLYKGSASYKNELMTLATAYGYKNNIIIKKSFSEGIEFLRGETLKETDLHEMIVSHSTDVAFDYSNALAPFDKLHQMTQVQGLHWCNHQIKGGHRNEENAIPGFNILVLDVEKSASISTAKLLLKKYKYLLYTTKRHTEESNRYRMLIPMNYTLKLDAKDYKEFMENVQSWLPFSVDIGTNQRARKWLSHDGHHEYNDGELLDVLPFIPKTSRSEQRKDALTSQEAMDSLERWFVNNTGDGNRNVMLHRYAMALVDTGMDGPVVVDAVVKLNNKLPDKLEETEIRMTIAKSISNAILKRP